MAHWKEFEDKHDKWVEEEKQKVAAAEEALRAAKARLDDVETKVWLEEASPALQALFERRVEVEKEGLASAQQRLEMFLEMEKTLYGGEEEAAKAKAAKAKAAAKAAKAAAKAGKAAT